MVSGTLEVLGDVELPLGTGKCYKGSCIGGACRTLLCILTTCEIQTPCRYLPTYLPTYLPASGPSATSISTFDRFPCPSAEVP
jgi:hypothetical protein